MKSIPDGFHTVTPNILVDGAAKAIALYEKALGAELMGRMDMPGTDTVMHAAMRIGSSPLFVADKTPMETRQPPGKDGSPVSFYLYVEDCDAAYKKALGAGMSSAFEPEDMFWGDRTAGVADPFGYRWVFATRVREVSEDEMNKAMKAMASA